MMVALIIQGFILLLFFIIKIWDWLRNTKTNFLYKIYVFMVFTLLIVGYLLFHFQAFAFSGLNFRNNNLDTHYFRLSFTAAILYIVVFVIFLVYAAFRIMGPLSYFNTRHHIDKFYFFFAGYKDGRKERSYDILVLLLHFCMGFCIGMLAYEGLALCIVLLICLLIILALSIILFPWRYKIWFFIELITQLILIAVVVIFLIMAIKDN